jgi:nucleotide-binding universal stress UspA family protein
MVIQNLLVASDFSVYSSMAERRAAIICKTYRCRKAEIVNIAKAESPQILVVIRKSSADKEASSIVEETLRQLEMRTNDLRNNFQVDFDRVVKFGHPAQEIIAYANEMHADLIIAGAHGGNIFDNLFLGNTTDKLVRMARRPLLVVKKEPVSEYSHILVPVDFTEDFLQATRLALAMHPQGCITLLHAYDVWYKGRMSYAGVEQETIDLHRRLAHESAHESMSLFIDKLGLPGRIVKRQLEFGMPSAVISKYAEKFQSDLIVMGKHGYSRLEELLIGSVTRSTIEHVQCDVLVVPAL